MRFIHFCQLIFQLFLNLLMLFATTQMILFECADSFSHIFQLILFQHKITIFQMTFDSVPNEFNTPGNILAIRPLDLIAGMTVIVAGIVRIQRWSACGLHCRLLSDLNIIGHYR